MHGFSSLNIRGFVRRSAMALLLLCMPFAVTAARAEGKFVAAANRVDVAYDDARGLLYISNGSQVLRYQLGTQTFLTPVSLGGQLLGMDISPDGTTLAVADASFSGTNNWVHLVNLDSLADNQVDFPLASGEGGTFAVAYDKKGKLLVSSQYQGSGWVPLRLYDPVHGKTSTVASVRQNSMLSASADGRVVALEESNISSGPFGRYKVKDGSFVENSGTDWFTYEIGVSRNENFYAVPTYGGTYVADKDLNFTGTIVGEYAGGQPVGVAFHPEKNLVYFPWAQSTMVKIYSTRTWSEVGSIDLESTFGANGNYAFVNGRAKTSKDGSLLFVTVDGGVRYVETKGHHG